MEPRKLERRTTFAREDILQLIRDNDLSDTNTFLVLNGGTGVGKTSSIMTEVKNELEKKFNKHQTMLVVESRTITVNQLNISYTDKIETFNGIDTCQRLGFMHRIQHNQIQYDWIVIDECHGLFSEASFADDAEYIASWIRSSRPEQTHIIFVTANDEYFEELSRQYFPGNFNFIYLFPDFTHYVSNTYVKEIQFIKTNRTDNVISTLLNKYANKKGIIFLKKASDVKDWFFRALGDGIQAGMLVSQANETTAALTTYQAKLAKDAAINLSEGQAGITMADLCELYDTVREKNGLESIRKALTQERLPDDIDMLFVTDTLQEGASIKSEIDYIIIEGFTEVEVRQKLGRFRGNLNLLYIIFNPASGRGQTFDKLRIFDQLKNWQENNNQTALAEFYGTQKGIKSKTLFLKKYIQEETQEVRYEINQPAYLNCLREYELYNRLMKDTEKTVIQTYSYPLLTGTPQILNYSNDIRNFNLEEKIKAIADKWRRIPLKGPAQKELIEDFKEAHITDKKRIYITTFRGCCACFSNYDISLKTRKATKKDLEDWPKYLKNIKEEFKYIE